MTFFHALGGVFTLLVLVLTGYILASRGWFGAETRKMIPRLVTNIALPPYLCCTILTSFPRENLAHMAYGALLPLASMFILFGCSFLLACLIGMTKRHLGLFCVCVSNPNTIFIGIPVNMALFGPEAVPYVLLYYLASTLFFWTIGNFFIARDERSALAGKSQPPQGFRWQTILSAPFLGFVAGMAIILAGWQPPAFLLNGGILIGQLAPPLALLYIGISLEGIGLRNIHLTRDLLLAVGGRMGFAPLVMYGLVLLFPTPALMAQVFIIQSSLPALMQVAILSGYYGTDPDFGSMVIAVSTLVSVLTVPVYMTVLTHVSLLPPI